MNEFRKCYLQWLKFATEDMDITEELKYMNETDMEDAFYRNLTFGTGGLRGIIGAGTNRMNVYTVAKASQGLADYLLCKYGRKASVVIGYDSRIKSDVFARTAASVFAANDITVYLWTELTPVSTVSFAIRYLRATAGVMVTASHNPSIYNGYKVYGFDGCQITTEAAEEILKYIEKVEIFYDVKKLSFNTAVEANRIKNIPDRIMAAFLDAVKTQSVLFGEYVDRNISIVYSPLNGTGYLPVTRVLEGVGYTNITLVEEQQQPDGRFPTCPYPNPEVKETMALGIEYARKNHADLFLATDPDCDRVGVAVKGKSGDYVLLSGNETGILLLDYICSQRIKHGKMPDDPVMIKTIVTTDMAIQIAKNYDVRTVNVLTGFKFIGEQIGQMEKEGRESCYIFGFEESCGYLSGSYIRDKDGVGGAYLICEMFSYYKTHGISLLDKLDELYQRYGYWRNTLYSFTFEGSAGFDRIQKIMEIFRSNVGEGLIIEGFSGKKIDTVLDYSKGLEGLPKSNVLKYLMEDNCVLVVRPSGTEPKLKIYISVSAPDMGAAKEIENRMVEEVTGFLESIGIQ